MLPDGGGRTALHAAARDEMAATLDDVLTQRLGVSLTAPDEAAAGAPACADAVGDVLGWDAAERERQVRAYVDGLARFRVPR
jgi:glycerol-3-phosphate dehydrogenase